MKPVSINVHGFYVSALPDLKGMPPSGVSG